MLVLSTQATAFATSCYLVARGRGENCLVVDPGAGAAQEVARMAEEHALTPVAVAATHGHPDHLWDAAAVADRWGVPFLLADGDLDRLDDPADYLGAGMSQMFGALAGGPWRRPGRVAALSSRTLPPAGLDLGLDVELVAAPGHTPGSTVILVPGAPAPDSALPPSAAAPPATPACAAFTGDVLFAGSIGRVDLAGGDGATMVRTLRELRGRLPLDAWLLPGHGPITTMRHELASNPYLDDRWLASGVL